MDDMRHLSVAAQRHGRTVVIRIPFASHYAAMAFIDRFTPDTAAAMLNAIGSVDEEYFPPGSKVA